MAEDKPASVEDAFPDFAPRLTDAQRVRVQRFLDYVWEREQDFREAGLPRSGSESGRPG